ncbi:MAG: NAD(P)/FAD-dependent oxidoreductase [bacterium]
MPQTLSADYLVVGAGAMGMAFVDVILNETQATVLLVDRYHQPGGHWNVAYPFVRLHQPSAFYGVNSRNLGADTIDTHGWNEGLYELATSSEVCAYFDQVMQQQFIPSGRLQYFPMCEYTGPGEFRSLLSDRTYRVEAGKTVDATYMNVTVPAMRAPSYSVAQGMTCVPPNALPTVTQAVARYVVIGAGKTGMDACLFLLKNGVDASRICWIMPRDSWLLDRANIQPGKLFSQSIGQGFARQTQAMAEATSINDLFSRIEACGQLLRLDPDIEPSMYRCATVTRAELDQLRRIQNVVRKGRVESIRADRLILQQGDVATDAQTLHIDCTADGLQRRPATAVFASDNLTLQSVRTCQQVFSAAFIGHVEAHYSDQTLQNELCTPVPHPNTAIDFLRTSLVSNTNAARWAQDADLQTWLLQARLDGFSNPANVPDTSDPATAQRLAKLGQASSAAMRNLKTLLDGADQP